MARKVLNKPVSSGGAAIKSVATTKTTRQSIGGQYNDYWLNSNGFSAVLNRQEADSRVLVDAPWRYYGNTHSYFAGMGIQSNYPNGSASKTHGWGFIWEHNTSDGDEGLLHCMKGLYDGHGLNNQTGNFTFKFGWESTNNDNNRVGEVWTASRSDDATGNANDMSYFTFIEISDSNTSWNNNSGGNS